MKLKDFEKLQNLMEMTRSPVEAEALAAISYANKIIDKYELTWERIFKRLVTVVNDFESDPEDGRSVKDSEANRINSAFEILYDTDLKGTFADFIESLKEQWMSKRFLTTSQQESLFKAARRAGEKK